MLIKEIHYGGLSKEQLLDRLKSSTIQLNAFAEILLFSPDFAMSTVKQSLSVAEITVGTLGLKQGGTLDQIRQQASRIGLMPCPLETAFYSRFYYDDQEQGTEATEVKNQNPPGSIVIFSEPLSADHTFPKGLYLRKINGELWLRGYRCSEDYIWAPSNTFLFQLNRPSDSKS